MFQNTCIFWCGGWLRWRSAAGLLWTWGKVKVGSPLCKPFNFHSSVSIEHRASYSRRHLVIAPISHQDLEVEVICVSRSTWLCGCWPVTKSTTMKRTLNILQSDSFRAVTDCNAVQSSKCACKFIKLSLVRLSCCSQKNVHLECCPCGG